MIVRTIFAFSSALLVFFLSACSRQPAATPTVALTATAAVAIPSSTPTLPLVELTEPVRPTPTPTSIPTDTPTPLATQTPVARPTATPVKATTQITIGWDQEPSAAISLYSNQTFAAWLGELTNVGLWSYDDHGKPVLELAQSFPDGANGGLSADGKTITYTLKKGLRWTDGQPLTSADMKFTWQQIMKPQNRGVYTRVGYDQIESIDTPSAQTAVVHFREAYAPWPTLFAQTGVAGNGLLPEHVLSETPSLDGSNFVLNAPVTAGPYRIARVARGDHIELEAASSYWRGRSPIDRILIRILPGREAVLAGLQDGTLDLGDDFTEVSIPDLQAIKGYTTYTRQTSSFEHYFFNLGASDDGVQGPCPFQDVRVRQAFIFAIDRFAIVNKFLFGRTRVIATLWPDSTFEDTSLQPYPYDPARAKSLLDQAGYLPGPDGIRQGNCNGQPVRLSFRHMTTSGDPLRADVQSFVRANLKDVGIEIIPDDKPATSLFAGWLDNGPLASGDYDMAGFATSFVNSGDPDPADYFTLAGIPTQAAPYGNNWYRLEDADLDRISHLQSQVVNPAQRAALIRQMQHIIFTKAYVIPLYARLNVDVASNRIKGILPSVDGHLFWNVWNWRVAVIP